MNDPWIEHARRLQSLCWQTTGAVARYLEEHFVPKEPETKTGRHEDRPA